jgi:hypothetical protein
LTERKVFADYAPDSQEEEQEEDDGADLMMHMQMKVNVDMPLDLQAPKAAKMSLAGAAASHTSNSHPKPRDSDVVAKAAVAAPLPPTAALSLLEEDAVEVPARRASELVDAEGAEPAATASSLPGVQLVLGALAAAFLVAIGAWLATSIGRSADGRKVVTEEELKTRAKAWMLDWALSYEPDDVEDEASIEAEIKVRPKKKAPPIAAGSDSGDTDEEEPEAESDYGELLEDAVFVAEQVEVANRHNEAVDTDYGIPEARLVDQIQHCDLR